jgi:hypothetical protein
VFEFVELPSRRFSTVAQLRAGSWPQRPGLRVVADPRAR